MYQCFFTNLNSMRDLWGVFKMMMKMMVKNEMMRNFFDDMNVKEKWR